MESGRKNRSLKRFIVIWMSFLVTCFAIIAVTMIFTTNRLQSMTVRLFTDSMALEYAHKLEINVLEERREDLLWRSTGDELHFRQKLRELQELDDNFKQLRINATSAEEHQIIDAIRRRFDPLKSATTSIPPPALEKISALTDSLLAYVENYRAQNHKQMSETIAASERLDSLVDRWSLIMIVLVSLMVATGSVMLIRRIIYPILNLIHTSNAFGQGDFNIRVPIYRQDEIGDLCERFNQMAADIQNHLQERRNFIAAVAHDLKNPLVVVGAAARKLKKDDLPQQERTVWLNYIIEDVEHLETLIGDLMDSAQIESGNLILRKTELEFTAFVKYVSQRQQSVVKSHQVEFEGEGEFWIQGDTKRLERVIQNLVSNAVKYSEEKSTVLLRVENDGTWAKLSVLDEGCGIEEDEIAKMFLPFERSSRTRGLADGSGIGLFSAKKIVEAHGGTINIQSKVGVGTTIEILLPLARTE